MSLRLRLTLIIGSAFVLLWALAAAWMLHDLRNQMMLSLDQRLAASARMVGGLLEQLPPTPPGEGRSGRISAEQLGIPDGLACQVTSLRGEVLARSHSAPGPTLDARQTGFREQLIDGEPWRSFTLAQGDLRITTSDRLKERDILGRSVLLAAALPVALALLGSLALLWFGIRQGLAPLQRMSEALTRRNADSLQPLALQPLPGELQPLLETQNQLLQRMANAIERERRLTGDAAHELRSPLTAIKTHLQVARMTAGEDAARALAQAEQGADRLHRTLEQLLLLARVEGSLSFDDGVPLGAEDVARLALQDAVQGDDRGIALRLPRGPANAPLALPGTLAVAALRNLLDNALQHSPPGLPVELSLEIRGERACFQVRDHGPGIDPQSLGHITQRFWRQGANGGCGLGLAIVQAIVLRCGCDLYFDSHGDGLRVELAMPLRRSP